MFQGPWKVLSRLGSFEPGAIAAAGSDAFKLLCSETPAIRRFPASMAGRMRVLASFIEAAYGGVTTRLWEEATLAEGLLKRSRSSGVSGKQKCQILAALLAKQLGVRPRAGRRRLATARWMAIGRSLTSSTGTHF